MRIWNRQILIIQILINRAVCGILISLTILESKAKYYKSYFINLLNISNTFHLTYNIKMHKLTVT